MELQPSLVFDYPTISAIAAHLLTRLDGQLSASADSDFATGGLQPRDIHNIESHPSAVVGVFGASSRSVGWETSRCDDLCFTGLNWTSSASYFCHLCSERAGDLSTLAPFGRWDVDDGMCIADSQSAGVLGFGEMPPRFGCFLQGVEMFDAGLFGVSPAEAVTMDPQQRLLMQVGRERHIAQEM